jgi:hypothetical protein
MEDEVHIPLFESDKFYLNRKMRFKITFVTFLGYVRPATMLSEVQAKLTKMKPFLTTPTIIFNNTSASKRGDLRLDRGLTSPEISLKEVSVTFSLAMQFFLTNFINDFLNSCYFS